MSESVTGEVKKTSEKKPRKVLTPKEIFKAQKDLLEKRTARIRNEQFQNVKSQKQMAYALLSEMAEKFNVEVKDIDFEFIEKLSFGNVAKNSANQEQVKADDKQNKQNEVLLKKIAEKFNVKVENIDLKFIDKLSFGDVTKNFSKQVDEKTFSVGESVSKLFPSDSSVEDISEKVKLGLNIIAALERETKNPFTESMLLKLTSFFVRQNTNGHWLNKALGLE